MEELDQVHRRRIRYRFNLIVPMDSGLLEGCASRSLSSKADRVEVL